MEASINNNKERFRKTLTVTHKTESMFGAFELFIE